MLAVFETGYIEWWLTAIKRSWQFAVGSSQLKTKNVKNRVIHSVSNAFAFYCQLPTANFPFDSEAAIKS